MPKQRKSRQRSKTKTWRKLNFKIVEELSIQKTQEVLRGGPLSEKKSEELFFEDKLNASLQKLSQKDKKNKWKNYVLSIYRNVQPNPYTKAEKVPLKKQKDDSSRKQILKLKRKLKRSNKEQSDQSKKTNSQSETEFFDLWTETSSTKNNTQNQQITENVCNLLTNSIPKNRQRRNPAKFPAVEVSDPGISYNPSYEDHQEYLRKVLDEQLKTEEKEKKLIKALKPPSKRKREEFEKSFTIDSLEINPNDINEDEDEESESTEPKVHCNKPFSGKKTKAQRKKEKRRKRMELFQKKQEEQNRLNEQLEKLPEIVKEIEMEEQLRSQAREISRKARELREKTRPNRLGKHRYKDDPAVYLCTDELPENLRSLSPQSDLLRERFKSLQKRNFVEVTVPVKKPKRRYRLKVVEKRSFRDPVQ